LRRAIERWPFIVRSKNRPAEKPDKIVKYATVRYKINITVSNFRFSPKDEFAENKL
jgi:hypothetical protein